MRNREDLDASLRCVPAQKFSELWGQPVDSNGKPYMVGYRICKRADCVEPKHVTQSRYIAKRIYGYMPKLHRGFDAAPLDGKQLMAIAAPTDKRNPPKTCKVYECNKPHRGLGLCNSHHSMLWRYRQKQGQHSRVRRDNSDIDRYIIATKGNHLSIKERYCHYPKCLDEYFARGLCRTHHKRWLRWMKRR